MSALAIKKASVFVFLGFKLTPFLEIRVTVSTMTHILVYFGYMDFSCLCLCLDLKMTPTYIFVVFKAIVLTPIDNYFGLRFDNCQFRL